MKKVALYCIGQMLAGLIVSVGLICWWFAIANRWPPTYVLIGASIGGAISPLLWIVIGRYRTPSDSEKSQA